MKFDLVFEGGGAKGAAFVGALQQLLSKHTYGRLMGTSAGAITATLLAAGYELGEMTATLNEQGDDGKHVFESFMDTPPEFSRSEIEQSAMRAFFRNVDLPFVPEFIERGIDNQLTSILAGNATTRHLFAFVERGGWFSAHNFTAWLQEKLENKKRGFSTMTLKRFFEATETELTLIAADSTDNRMLILNHHTAPDCPLVSAVHMSMNIPLIWPEAEWLAEWGSYRDKDITGHFVVDGGLVSPFPLSLFVSNAPHVTKIMGENFSDSVLGMLIDEKLPVEGAPEAPEKENWLGIDLQELQTAQRLQRLLETATQAHDKLIIDEFEKNVVHLPAKGYGSTEFNMTQERRNALVLAGRNAMDDFLDQNALESLSDDLFDFSIGPDLVKRANNMAGRMLRE